MGLLNTYGEGIPPPIDQLRQIIDLMTAKVGRMKAKQGRIAEGEADVRRALLNRLKATGKYNLQTSEYVGMLANMLVEQGRFAEAEADARAVGNPEYDRLTERFAELRGNAQPARVGHQSAGPLERSHRGSTTKSKWRCGTGSRGAARHWS